MRTVISNGSYKFHLAPLASELAKSNNLAAFFTAGYPQGVALDVLKKISIKSVQRLIDRRENIPEVLVNAFNNTEIYFKLGDTFRNFSQDLQHRLHIKAFESYSRQATHALKKTTFDIYHYRNCYGLKSAEWTLEQGKKTICDHSIGHPYAISYILNGEGNGNLPDNLPQQPLNRLEKHFLSDFDNASAILVNSEFVKKTSVASGFAPSNIHVVYLGVDDQILEASNSILLSTQKTMGHKDLLFCGQWGPRKGALQIMDSLELLADEDWTLTIAGGIDPIILPRWTSFFNRFKNRVWDLGVLTRIELAALMAKYQIFVFPSLMEGSARVIFEALTSGCFIITTPNAGSIVQEGVHGTLIDPKSVDSLVQALQRIWSNHYDLQSIGKFNQENVRSSFRQNQYASKVLQVYDCVLGN